MSDVDKYAWKLGAVILVLTILFLQACGTANTIQLLHDDPSIDLADALSKVSIADLDAAYADALAHNDVLAVACYPVLKTYLGKLEGSTQDKPIGVLSAYQRARDLRLVVGDLKIPDDLRLGCAAMVDDSKAFVIKMIILTGGSAKP